MTRPPEHVSDDIDPGESLGSRALARLAWLADMPYWALSAVAHLVLLLLLTSLAFRVPAEPEPAKPLSVRMGSSTPAPAPVDVDLADTGPVRLEPRVRSHGPVDPMSVEIESAGLDAATIERVVPSLDLSRLTLVGAGISRASHLGDRRGKSTLVREGGGAAGEESVLRALEWLTRHQSPDGSWRAADFVTCCERTRCRNEDADRFGDGRGPQEHDVGITGLALLAFTGAGYTHQHGARSDFVEAVRRGSGWLREVQVASDDPKLDGRFGSTRHTKWIYDHAIATMALTELYVMSHDVIQLRAPVTRAIRQCLGARNPGKAWRYGYRPGDDDVSVTGWMVLALKAARYADLTDLPRSEVEEALRAAGAYCRDATAGSGRTGYTRAGERDNRHKWPDPIEFEGDKSCMTSVSVLSRLVLGEPRTEPTLRRGAEILSRHPPQWTPDSKRSDSTINFYYWYYGTYAMFQYGGVAWQEWNDAMLRALLPHQRRGGCEDGSWDPIGEWANLGGRVYSTALGAMTLEVYYRFRRVTEDD